MTDEAAVSGPVSADSDEPFNADEYSTALAGTLTAGPKGKAPPAPTPHPVQDLWDRLKAPKDDSAVRPAAGIEMQQTGITDQQKQGHTPGVSEALQRFIPPSNYPLGVVSAKENAGKMVKAAAGLSVDRAEAPSPTSNGDRYKLPVAQEDAWKLYLGMPESSREFGVSPYRPSKGTDAGSEYLRIHNFLPRFTQAHAAQYGTTPEKEMQDLVTRVKGSGGKLAMNDDDIALQKDTPYGVMRNFSVSHGQDGIGPYLAYYDKWDLHTPGADLVGKPYELYDRTYYDPKTFKVIPEAEVLAKKAGLSLKESK